MKNTIGIAALACSLVAGPTLAKAQDTSDIATLAVALLSSQFGISQPSIFADADRYDTSVYDLEPAYYIRAHSKRATMARIMELRREGYSWDEIGRILGLPTRYVYQLGHSGSYYPNNYWGNWANRRWQVPRTQFIEVRRAGAPWQDAFLATRIARQHRTQPIYVWRSYRTHKTWKRIVLPNRRVVYYNPPKRKTWSNNWTKTRYDQRANRTTNWNTTKKRGHVEVWEHDGRKVDVRKKTIYRPGRTIRSTTIKNPRQVIHQRSVYTKGHVTRKVTHVKDRKNSKHLSKDQRKKTQWHLKHPKHR